MTRWRAVLKSGVDHWSDYSDTDDDRDRFDDECEDDERRRRDDVELRRSIGEDLDSLGHAKESSRDPSSGNSSDDKDADVHASAGARPSTMRTEGGETRADRDGGANDDGERAGERASGDEFGGADGVDDNVKVGLGGAWRIERRDLEWQCLWIELRAREIDRHVARYEARLRAMKRNDDAAGASGDKGEAEDVRAGTIGDSARAKRSTVEANSENCAQVILGHPMFALLDDASEDKEPTSAKKRLNPGANDPSTTTTTELSGAKAGGTLKRVASPDTNPKSSEEKKRKVMDGIAPKETNSDSDISTTALYEQIDAAKKRVESLKERLSKTAPKLEKQKSASDKFKTPGSKNRSDKTTSDKTPVSVSGKRLSTRGVDAYDINNVISAQGPAKYVERAIHETIATPRVRAASALTAAFDASTDGESSDEDISDEVYIVRHAKLEAEEKSAREPLVRGRSGQKQATPTGKQVSLFDEDVDDETLERNFDIVMNDAPTNA